MGYMVILVYYLIKGDYSQGVEVCSLRVLGLELKVSASVSMVS